MKPFLLFLVYAMITCLFSFVLCFTEFMRCEVLDSYNRCKSNYSSYEMLMAFNKGVAIFGMVFTLSMSFCSLAALMAQLMRISDNVGLIDRLKIQESP